MVYEIIEYLEGTGTLYIDTNFKPNQDTRIVATMLCVTSNDYARLFGSGMYNTANSIMLDYEKGATGTLKIKYGIKTAWTTVSSVTGDYNVHTYDYNKNKVYRDSIQVSSDTYTAFLCTYNLGIFTYINNTGSTSAAANEYFKGRCYGFQIYDNGVLVRDYIPVKFLGTGYLYDKVTKELFENSGTGNFIIGPVTGEVISTASYDAEIEYLETASYNGSSNGTQYIDIGLKGSSNTSFDIDMYVPTWNNDKGLWLFGARTAQGNKEYGIYINPNNGSGYWRFNTSKEISTTFTEGRYNLNNTTDPASLKINNITAATISTSAWEGEYNIILFGINLAGSIALGNNQIGTRLYSAKWYVNDVLVRDFIPVRIGQTGYLYDKVSKQLFGNLGTGQFILGNDVNLTEDKSKEVSTKIRRSIFLRLRFDSALPYDLELEYIETTGAGQYLTLDVSPDITTDACEVYFQLNTNVQQGVFFSGSKMYAYINASNNFAFNRYTGSDSWQLIYATNVGTIRRKLKVDYLNKLVRIDDYLRYTMTGTIVNPATIPTSVRLFTSGDSGYVVSRNLKAKIFHVKYWKNGELIRDLIPVRKGNIGGMYDKITKKIYFNKGNGLFVLGRDRYENEKDYTIPDYVMSAASLIDVVHSATGNTRIILDFLDSVTTGDADWHEPFGSRTSAKSAEFTFQNVVYDGGANNLVPRDTYGNNAVYLDNTRINLERIVLDKNRGNTTIKSYYNNTVSSSTTRANLSFNAGINFWLGFFNNGNKTAYSSNSNFAFFNFKVFENDILIRDYIPAIHPDGTCGMFDKVQKHFYNSETSVKFRPGYLGVTSEGEHYVFFNRGINASLNYTRNNSDLLSSLIPIKSRRIKVKKDPNYETTIVEYGTRKLIRKGGQTVISQESDGDIIELSSDCTAVAVLIEGASEIYHPNIDITNVGDINYLAFTALEDGTFTFTMASTLTPAQYSYIEYSTDGGTSWERTYNLNATVTVTTPTVLLGNKVLWRGKGQRTANGTTAGTMYSKFSSTGTFDVSGNIASLLYGENFYKTDNTPTGDGYTFGGLFVGSKVVHAHDLCLPIFRLRTYGYWALLNGCPNLISSPKLNSIKLEIRCYLSMFYGSTALNDLPYLPAKYLMQYCYYLLFRGCTSITSIGTIIPTITNLTSTYTFSRMFLDCTSLVDASALNLSLVNLGYTYSYMFSGCTSLTLPPTIGAGSLATYVCEHMFDGCTSLVTAPALGATTLNTYCYQFMFLNCTSLTNPPALPATTLSNYCYLHMFDNCTSLVNAPVLPCKGTISTLAYFCMFRGCSSLVNPPELPATIIGTSGYNSMFAECTSLSVAPELNSIVLGTACYAGMFRNTAITEAPQLSASIVPSLAYYGMFAGCNNLNYIKCTAADLSASETTLNWTCAWDTENETYDTENSGVASTGTFIQRAGVEWTTGVSGIPTGWTIIYINPEDGKYYTDSACTTLWNNTPALPYTSKIEYLQNDGTTALIATGLNRTNVNKLELKFYVDNHVNYARLVSNNISANYNCIIVELSGTSGKLATWFDTKENGGATTIDCELLEIHTITMEKASLIDLDGVETAITNTTSGTANTNTIALFAPNITSTTTYASSRRIYYFKAWYNGVLMRNLIPVRVGTEGAMYDLASGELLENPMSGEFVLGNDVV